MKKKKKNLKKKKDFLKRANLMASTNEGKMWKLRGKLLSWLCTPSH